MILDSRKLSQLAVKSVSPQMGLAASEEHVTPHVIDTRDHPKRLALSPANLRYQLFSGRLQAPTAYLQRRCFFELLLAQNGGSVGSSADKIREAL